MEANHKQGAVVDTVDGKSPTSVSFVLPPHSVPIDHDQVKDNAEILRITAAPWDESCRVLSRSVSAKPLLPLFHSALPTLDAQSAAAASSRAMARVEECVRFDNTGPGTTFSGGPLPMENVLQSLLSNTGSLGRNTAAEAFDSSRGVTLLYAKDAPLNLPSRENPHANMIQSGSVKESGDDCQATLRLAVQFAMAVMQKAQQGGNFSSKSQVTIAVKQALEPAAVEPSPRIEELADTEEKTEEKPPAISMGGNIPTSRAQRQNKPRERLSPSEDSTVDACNLGSRVSFSVPIEASSTKGESCEKQELVAEYSIMAKDVSDTVMSRQQGQEFDKNDNQVWLDPVEDPFEANESFSPPIFDEDSFGVKVPSHSTGPLIAKFSNGGKAPLAHDAAAKQDPDLARVEEDDRKLDVPNADVFQSLQNETESGRKRRLKADKKARKKAKKAKKREKKLKRHSKEGHIQDSEPNVSNEHGNKKQRIVQDNSATDAAVSNCSPTPQKCRVERDISDEIELAKSNFKKARATRQYTSRLPRGTKTASANGYGTRQYHPTNTLAKNFGSSLSDGFACAGRGNRVSHTVASGPSVFQTTSRNEPLTNQKQPAPPLATPSLNKTQQTLTGSQLRQVPGTGSHNLLSYSRKHQGPSSRPNGQENQAQNAQISQTGTKTMQALPATTNDASMPPVELLCSDTFFETWGDIVAALSNGTWLATSVARTRSAGAADPEIGRKIQLFDTALVRSRGVDIELPKRGGVLIFTTSALQNPIETKSILMDLAQLAAIGRYSYIYVFLCYDVPMTDAILRHVALLQNSVIQQNSQPSTQVLFKTTREVSLAESVAETIFFCESLCPNQATSRLQAVAADQLLLQRAWFLAVLAPTLSANGAIQCIKLAQRLVPGGQYFRRLLQDQSLRQQIMMAATSTPSKAPEIGPHAMGQLSKAVDTGVESSLEQHQTV